MRAPAPFVDAAEAMCAATEEEEWLRPFPPREACSVTPLIEAADVFPAFETMVLEAERSVWMAFRIFDPDTKARSERAKAEGLEDWAAILRAALRRGISIRILLADFEPVLADYLHAGSWSTYRSIRALVDELDEADRDRLQLIVIQHDGEHGWAWRQLLRLPLRRRIRRIVTKLIGKRDGYGGLESRPGLWPHVDWHGEEPRGWKASAPPRLWPATYHQKFIVADGLHAIVGGMDLDERRWDDRRHRQRADRTWHDISARLEGPAVGDAARHFALLWNRELPRYRAIVGEWTGSCEHQLMLDPLTEVPPEPAIPDPVESAAATVQIVRTMSRENGSPFALGPGAAVREIKAAHRKLIGMARRQLYIEGQFFRSAAAADWIVAALARNPELEVIILVANVPEEIAFEGQADNLAHRHGEHLQARALGRLLRKAGPQRVGLFTLAKHEPVQREEQQFEDSRGTAFGSGVIHIHSKLLIADDAACLLSSANINGRSFEWDTELGFLWTEPGDAIPAFKRRLWRQSFGETLPEGMDLEGWRDVARFNSGAEPTQRQGFVVPYQLGRARRFGRPYWFVPDDLV